MTFKITKPIPGRKDFQVGEQVTAQPSKWLPKCWNIRSIHSAVQKEIFGLPKEFLEEVEELNAN